MYDSPQTLENICLIYICDNLRDIFEFYYEKTENDRGDPGVKTKPIKKFRFTDNDLFLFNELSEKLLNKLGEKHLISDTTLSLFAERNTRLRTVKIKNTLKVTYEGLKILKQHKIVDLEIVNLKNVCISKILGLYHTCIITI